MWLRLRISPLLDCRFLKHEDGPTILLAHLSARLQYVKLLLGHLDGVLKFTIDLVFFPAFLLVFDSFAAPVILERGNHVVEEV